MSLIRKNYVRGSVGTIAFGCSAHTFGVCMAFANQLLPRASPQHVLLALLLLVLLLLRLRCCSAAADGTAAV